jgi:hypothetical protein
MMDAGVWKNAVMFLSRCYFNNYLEILKKTAKIVSQETGVPKEIRT